MKQNIIWFIYVKWQSISTEPGVNIRQFTIYSCGFKSRKIFSFIKQVSIIAIFWDLQPLWPSWLMKPVLIRFKCSSGHVLSKTKLVTPHFFTFLTSLTHHLSMVKFSKKSMLENFCMNVLKMKFLRLLILITHGSWMIWVTRQRKFRIKQGEGGRTQFLHMLLLMLNVFNPCTRITKTNMPLIQGSFYLLNACCIFAIFPCNWTQCVLGFSLFLQWYVRNGNDAKDSENRTVQYGACAVTRKIETAFAETSISNDQVVRILRKLAKR